uniref:CATH1 n=1 Tax=Andrias davidianus TaxID=141262 RepID=A0A223M042_ANDDA|nr:cathelicidin precursor [Andrias davidianus]ASU10865.1 CATH1 [Andrias davidianus]
MESCLKALLVLVVSTAVSSAQETPGSLVDNAIDIAIGIYNDQKNSDYLFRRTEDDDAQPSTSEQLKFRIKETVCPNSAEELPEECDFKVDGTVKNCTAYVIKEDIEVVVNCDTVKPKKVQGRKAEKDNGDGTTAANASGKKKSSNVFMTLLNKLLELFGVKQSGDDSNSLGIQWLLDMFSK